MSRDRLNRRNRFEAPQSTGKRICLTERDVLMFTALERHGVLPAPYLHEFAKPAAQSAKAHQHRLTALTNEDNTAHGCAYLIRPSAQWASPHARYQPISYVLSPYGAKALRERGIARQALVNPSGVFIHRAMCGCITASIDLACQAEGLRYIPQGEILRRAPAIDAKNPLALPSHCGVILPDQLFGIDYGGTYRFFALEADRSTESLESQRYQTRSFEAKLRAYADVLARETFRQIWGIPVLYILIVTTSERHAQTMQRIVERIAPPRTAPRFLFQYAPIFAHYWTVPGILHTLAREKWQRAGEPFGLLNR